jgi:hypothetical protein
MAWTNPNAPNITDFLSFVADNMQIPSSALPAGSPWPQYALDRAINLVFSIPAVAATDYTIAVYNCAGHILLGLAPDQTGQTYFQTARVSFDMLEASSGVIASSGDQGTYNAFAVPESLTKLTVGDLYFFKTPWGREYLAYAQDFGEIAGLT